MVFCFGLVCLFVCLVNYFYIYFLKVFVVVGGGGIGIGVGVFFFFDSMFGNHHP